MEIKDNQPYISPSDNETPPPPVAKSALSIGDSFVFSGWSLSESDNTPDENALKNVEQDRTVYACWNKEEEEIPEGYWRVRFINDSSGEEEIVATVIVENGGRLIVPDEARNTEWKGEGRNSLIAYYEKGRENSNGTVVSDYNVIDTSNTVTVSGNCDVYAFFGYAQAPSVGFAFSIPSINTVNFHNEDGVIIETAYVETGKYATFKGDLNSLLTKTSASSIRTLGMFSLDRVTYNDNEGSGFYLNNFPITNSCELYPHLCKEPHASAIL